MNVDRSLKGLSLNELLDLFSDATKRLLESKVMNESAEIVSENQRLVDSIQKALVEKRNAERPGEKLFP